MAVIRFFTSFNTKFYYFKKLVVYIVQVACGGKPALPSGRFYGLKCGSEKIGGFRFVYID
jgi:hypothetical protein